LIGHAVLHSNAAAERGDAVDRAFRDRLRVIEKPVDASRNRMNGIEPIPNLS
jgi:hypothetical protein